MSTVGWTFLTNYTHVLVCITRDPDVTMRTIADQVGITERAVQRIVGELVDDGYLTRTRDGRRNTYTVNSAEPLRHPLERRTRLQDLLALLAEADDPTATAARTEAHAPQPLET